MPEHDVQWSRYPTVVNEPAARAWLRMQAERNLAKHTVETYGRSMEDFLRFTGREGIQPTQATREHLARELGTDTAATSATQVTRLPGFLYLKTPIVVTREIRRCSKNLTMRR